VDTYFDPMGWYTREHDFKWHAQYLPSVIYLVTLRANALSLDPVLDSSYDPYAFLRDAYRQHRLYKIYYGNPPLSAIETLQGTSQNEENDQDLDRLLLQQHEYEKAHAVGGNAVPEGSRPPPASASSAATPIPASSVNSPPSSG
jgi:phospholipid-binding lipoprotein MlaA